MELGGKLTGRMLTVVLFTTTSLATGSLAHGVSQEVAEALAAGFAEGTVIGTPQLVDCTLSGGSATKCVAITVDGTPSDHAAGPWCPGNIADGPEAGGIWLEQGAVHDVDGRFVENLATFYEDPVWSLFDPESGRINVTDSFESCLAAARPDVAEEFNNYCVECDLAYFPEATQHTYVVPLHPVPTPEPAPARGAIGVALNGVRIDGPAPRDAILDAHTLAPFDDCGGHVNPFEGYHYHAITGCSTARESLDGHAPMIGYAMDGYGIFARFDSEGGEPADLDQCRGHETAGLGYHYHANAAGSNQILPCLRAEQGCSNSGDDTSCDATARRGPPPGARPGGAQDGALDGQPPVQ